MEALSPELALVDDELASAARAALAPAPDVFAALEQVRTNRDVVRRLRDSFNAQEAAVAEQASVRRPSGVRRPLAGVAFASTVAVGAIVTGTLALGRDDVSEPRALASNAPAATPVSAPAPATRPAVKPRWSVGSPVARRAAPGVKPEQKQRRANAAPRSKPKLTPTVVSTPRPARRAATPARKTPGATKTSVLRPRPTPELTWPIQRQATYYRVAVYRLGRSPGFLFEVWTDKTRLAVPATWGSAAEHNRLEPGEYGWAVFPTFGALGEAPADRAAAAPLTGGHFTV